jgi:hypothetical protein
MELTAIIAVNSIQRVDKRYHTSEHNALISWQQNVLGFSEAFTDANAE